VAESALFDKLKEKGYRLETVPSGYTKVFSSSYPRHIAVVEANGSISLSRDIASQFDGSLPRSGRGGRFVCICTAEEFLAADIAAPESEEPESPEAAVPEGEEQSPEDETAPEVAEKKKIEGLKWYTLHVYSGQEKKVASYLENEIKRAKLEDRITRILIPQEKIIEMKNGKKVEKQKFFFPGYVLVEMVLDKETRHMMLSSPGVINFLGSPHAPQVVQESEIERILGRTVEREEADSAKAPFRVGDSVKVIDGPFNDFSGFIEEVNPEKNKVKVMVSIFGRPTPVELNFLQVEREK